MFAKDTKSFTYVLPSICFPKSNIESIPKGVTLRLRWICYSDKKFEKHSAEYQNYLIARDSKTGKVKKPFSDIKKLAREDARKLKLHKTTFSTSCNLITQYNTLLPNLCCPSLETIYLFYTLINKCLIFFHKCHIQKK